MNYWLHFMYDCIAFPPYFVHRVGKMTKRKLLQSLGQPNSDKSLHQPWPAERLQKPGSGVIEAATENVNVSHAVGMISAILWGALSCFLHLPPLLLGYFCLVWQKSCNLMLFLEQRVPLVWYKLLSELLSE